MLAFYFTNMFNAKLSIDNEVNFMLKHSLTPNELFLLRTIFLAQEDQYKYLIDYFTESKLDLRNLLQSLQEKEIINSNYKIPEKGKVFNPGDVPINKNVIKSFLKHSQELGMDLFMNYPAYTEINGKTFSLRNIAKSFKNFDDFCFNYGKMINFAPETHKEILKLLEWGKENHKIVSGISDFVLSMKWLDLQQMKNDEISDNNWDIHELVG